MAIGFDRARLRAAVGRYYEEPIARALIFLRVGPNAVTLFGLALACVTAYLIAIDELVWGGVMLLVSAGLDSIDGTVARLSGKASAAGALLDSVVDRVSEGVVLFGVLWLAVERGDERLVYLTYAAFVGSMLVSYVVARAQGLGATRAVGLMSRPERVLVLAAGLLTGYVTIAVAVIAALAPLTALHRLWYGWSTLRKGGGE
ncbi:MAG: CDP-alcohol phosphatidyltransferase family protein [Chloroflexota bacterium]|nr:CDP-alcohol phosphatidyltransferase family protein [Chloroflexota bacterium]